MVTCRYDWELFGLDAEDNVYVFRADFAEKSIDVKVYKPGNWATNAQPAAQHIIPAPWLRDNVQ